MNASDFFKKSTTNNSDKPTNQSSTGEVTPDYSSLLPIDAYTPKTSPVIDMAVQANRDSYSVDASLVKKYNDYGLTWSPWTDTLDKQLADRQSNWAKAGNALAQTVVSEIGLGTTIGVGNLVDGIINLFMDEEQDYTSPFTETLMGWQEQFKEFAPIYADPDKSFTDFGWYMQNIPSIASSLTLLIPGAGVTYGLGKAFSAIGKIGRLSTRAKIAIRNFETINRIKNGSKMISTGFTQRFLENYQEAAQVNGEMYPEAVAALDKMKDNGTYEDYIERHQERFKNIDINDTKAVAKKIASDAADENFRGNMINAVFDVWQLYALRNAKAFMNGASRAAVRRAHINSMKYVGMNPKEIAVELSKRPLRNKIKDKMSDWTYGAWVATTAELSEGVEEAINFISQEEGMRYGRMLLEQELDNKMTTFGDRLVEYMAAPGLRESAFWGVVGGVTFQAAGSGLNRLGRSLELRKQLKKIEDPKTREELANRHWFAQTQEIESRVNDIQARAAAYQTLKAKMKQINDDHQDPYRKDIGGKNAELNTEEERQAARERVLADYTQQLLTNSMFSGNFDMTVAYLQSDAVKKAMVAEGILTQEQADKRQQEMQAVADRIVDLYYDNMKAVNNALLNKKNKDLAEIPFEYYQIVAAENMQHQFLADKYQSYVNVENGKIESEETRLGEELKALERNGISAKEAVRMIALSQALGQCEAEIEAIQTKATDIAADPRTAAGQVRMKKLEARREILLEMLSNEFEDSAPAHQLAKMLLVANGAKEVSLLDDGTFSSETPENSKRYQHFKESFDALNKIINDELTANEEYDKLDNDLQIEKHFRSAVTDLFGISTFKGKYDKLDADLIRNAVTEYNTLQKDLGSILAEEDDTKTPEEQSSLVQLDKLSKDLKDAYALAVFNEIERKVELSQIAKDADGILLNAQLKHNFDASAPVRAFFIESQLNTLKRIARDNGFTYETLLRLPDGQTSRSIFVRALDDKEADKELQEKLSPEDYRAYKDAMEALALAKPINKVLGEIVNDALIQSAIDEFVDVQNETEGNVNTESETNTENASSEASESTHTEPTDTSSTNTNTSNSATSEASSSTGMSSVKGELFDDAMHRKPFTKRKDGRMIGGLAFEGENDKSGKPTKIQRDMTSENRAIFLNNTDDPHKVEMDAKFGAENADDDAMYSNENLFTIVHPIASGGVIVKNPILTFDKDGNITAIEKGVIAKPDSAAAYDATATSETGTNEAVSENSTETEKAAPATEEADDASSTGVPTDEDFEKDDTLNSEQPTENSEENDISTGDELLEGDIINQVQLAIEVTQASGDTAFDYDLFINTLYPNVTAYPEATADDRAKAFVKAKSKVKELVEAAGLKFVDVEFVDDAEVETKPKTGKKKTTSKKTTTKRKTKSQKETKKLLNDGAQMSIMLDEELESQNRRETKVESLQRGLNDIFGQLMTNYFNTVPKVIINGKTLISVENVLRYCIDATGNDYLARVLYDNIIDYIDNHEEYKTVEYDSQLENKNSMLEKAKAEPTRRSPMANARRIDIKWLLNSNELSEEAKKDLIARFDKLQVGDKLEYRNTSNGHVEILLNGKPLGRLYVPSMNKNHTMYSAVNKGWKLDIPIDENEPFAVQSFITELLTGTDPELKAFRELLNTVYYQKRTTKKDGDVSNYKRIMKALKQLNLYNKPEYKNKLFDFNNNSEEDAIKYLMMIYRTMTKYTVNNINGKKNVVEGQRKVIKEWFDAIRESYSTASRLAGNYGIQLEVDYVNEGGLIITDTPRRVTEPGVIGTQHVKGIHLAVSDGKTTHLSNGDAIPNATSGQYTAGSTMLAIKRKNGTYAMAHAYPLAIKVALEDKSISEVHQMVNDLIKGFTDAVSAWNDDFDNVDKYNAIFSYIEALTGKQGKKSNHSFLFKGVKVITNKYNHKQILYSDENGDTHSIRFYNSKHDNHAVVQFDDDAGFAFGKKATKAKVTKKLKSILSNYLTFNIAYDHIQNVGSSSTSVGKTNKQKQFVVTLPTGKTYTFKSVESFFIDNGLIAVTTEARAESGTNFKGIANTDSYEENGTATFRIVEDGKTDKIVDDTTKAKEEKEVSEEDITKAMHLYDSISTALKEQTVMNMTEFLSKGLLSKTQYEILQKSGLVLQMLDQKVIFAPELGYNAIASYNKDNDVIKLGPVWLSLIPDTKGREQAFRQLMHESVHRQMSKLSEQQKTELLEEVKSIFNQWREFNRANKIVNDTFGLFKIDGVKLNSRYLTEDGLTMDGAEEFLVESLTRPEIIKSLNSIQADSNMPISNEQFGDIKSESIFQKILAVIAKLFNLDLNKGSLLEKEYNLFNKFASDANTTNATSNSTETTETNTKQEDELEDLEDDDFSLYSDAHIASMAQVRDSLFYKNRPNYQQLVDAGLINNVCKL